MKKIIAIAISAVLMAASTFALGLSAGVKGDIGQTMGNEWAQVKSDVMAINMNSEFDFGFGGFVNVDIINGLGIMTECDVVKSKIQFTGAKADEATDKDKWTTKDYDVWMIDVPVMIWNNVDIWKFRLGMGVGVNFSFNLDAEDRASFENVYEKAKSVYTEKNFIMGAVAGIDGTFFITDNIGLVSSVRYIGNFEKTTANYPIEGTDGVDYPSVKFNRNSFYGGLGVVVKVF